MKKLFCLLTIAVLTLITAGCITTKTVDYTQALQVSENTPLYTAYNIWYEIPWKISSINYQKGKIIPFGSAVKIISIENDTIRFKRLSNSREYSITYQEKYGLKPVEEFVRKLFTTKSRKELSKGISAEQLKKIESGIVEKGYTRKEVELAFGPPSPHRTPLKEGMTWIYWKSRFNTMRIIFKDDKVEDIID